MSRFSPTVLPTSGRAFANALGQGVNTFLATRDRTRQQAIEDEQRQRSEAAQNAQLGEQGIHLTPGELPPQFNVNVTGGPNPDDIVSSAITGQPAPTGKPLAAALSRNLSFGPGYYVDRDEQAQHLTQQATIAQAQALAKALGEGTAQNILDPNARADKHAVAQSTVAKNNADATRPRAPLPGTPEWRQMKIDEAKIGAQYGYHPEPQPQIVSAVDPKDGQSHFYRVPKTGGDAQEIGGLAPKPNASGANGGSSGMGQGIQARLLGAISEARAASQRMDAYENKMLANPSEATPGFVNQIGGKLATRLAGSHSLSGIIGETAGEATTDPEYLQYVRDAGLMARATQLMSSRGGSEAMVSAEQLLNRAVPNAAGLAESVAAARKSRNAIFGKTGGLMQALSPEQIAKVEAGLAALEHGESNSPALLEAGRIIAGAQAQPAPRAAAPKSGNVDLRQSAVSPLRAKYEAAVKHLRETGRAAEIPNLPVPPEE